MPKRTKKHETWLYDKLTDPRVAESYINAALEESQEMFLVAMRNVAEAHRMAKIAQEAGVNRESLYRAFSKLGNPTLNTLTSVLEAMGMAFTVKLKTPTTGTIPEPRNSSNEVLTIAGTEGAIISQIDAKNPSGYIPTETREPVPRFFSVPVPDLDAQAA